MYVPCEQEGCVEKRTGTVLTNNSMSATYNVAAFSGDGVINSVLKTVELK